MIILDQTTDLAGKIRMTCQLSNGETLALKFQEQPTTTVLEEIETNYLANHQYDTIQQETISIYDHANVIKDFIAKVKATPTVTLAQYNTYLAAKPWYESAIIRFFVFKLATALDQKNGIVLASLTETEVLTKLRNWIVATQAAQIAKTVLNTTDI